MTNGSRPTFSSPIAPIYVKQDKESGVGGGRVQMGVGPGVGAEQETDIHVFKCFHRFHS